jgi:site-specific DNA-methyltransferase (adenine-specific)
LFGESLQNLSRDLELAQVIGTIPELSKAKTKTEAQKMLQKFKKHAENKYVADVLASRERDTPLEKTQQKLNESFVVADVFTKLPGIPSNSINLIEIDPPYGIDLTKQRKVLTEGSTTLTYNEVPAEKYQTFLASLFAECYRVLASDGWLLCWFGPDPWYDVVRDELKAAGFKVAGIPAAWVKPNGQTMNPKMRLGNSYELFFYASKGNAELNRQGRANTFCYKLVPPDKKIHPTERPIELIEDVLQTFAMPGATVMVPFAGSGNTLLAAANVKMFAFGYDLSKEYKDAYTVRVHCGKPGEYKSYA